MKNTIFAVIAALVFQSPVLCQQASDISKAMKLGFQGIRFVEQGKQDSALSSFSKAMELDPENITYPYEKALVYYQIKDNASAIKILDSLLTHPQVNEQVFQLLGNSYDNTDSTDKALEIYNKGLEKFPNAGRLFMEIGLVEQKLRKKSTEILNNWDRGIELDPNFPYNYYYASNYYIRTAEKIWAVFYAEIFMNIADNPNRVEEISKLLFELYKGGVNFTRTTGSSKFSSVKIYSDNTNDESIRRFENAFQLVFEKAVTKNLEDSTALNLELLNAIRKDFVKEWFKRKFNIRFPNALLSWFKVLMDDNHFDAYNYFMFRNVDKDEYKKWAEKNRKKMGEFARWADSHRLTLSGTNRFYRYQYDK